jgi:hypothetical protein
MGLCRPVPFTAYDAIMPGAGWSWFDLAGNCHLSVPDAFQIERTGQPPIHRLPKSGANLSTPEAARILRALLATDNAGRKWTQRDCSFTLDRTSALVW